MYRVLKWTSRAMHFNLLLLWLASLSFKPSNELLIRIVKLFLFFRLLSLPFPFNFLRFFKKLFSVLLNQVHVEAFARASLEDRTLSLWPRLSGKLDKREMQFSYVFLWASMKPEMRCRVSSDWQKTLRWRNGKLTLTLKKTKTGLCGRRVELFFILRRVAVIDHFCACCAALPNEGWNCRLLCGFICTNQTMIFVSNSEKFCNSLLLFPFLWEIITKLFLCGLCADTALL